MTALTVYATNMPPIPTGKGTLYVSSRQDWGEIPTREWPNRFYNFERGTYTRVPSPRKIRKKQVRLLERKRELAAWLHRRYIQPMRRWCRKNRYYQFGAKIGVLARSVSTKRAKIYRRKAMS